MAIVEYERGTAFPGRIGRTATESSPAWPAPTRAAEGAPNVLLFILDDVGYGQLGCFGGLVDTPNVDRVARAGLRYANMHTTSLCSPSRACVLTGRNHHSSGVACVMEAATGFPGYDGRMHSSCTTPGAAAMLRTMRPRIGSNAVAAGTTTAGRHIAARVSHGRRKWACYRRPPNSPRTILTCRTGRACQTTSIGSTPG